MDMETETNMEMETDNTWKWTWPRTLTWNWRIFAKYFIRAIVPIAPYGMPLKYHGVISNGDIYLERPFIMETMTWTF
jgi:hypothetical protein